MEEIKMRNKKTIIVCLLLVACMLMVSAVVYAGKPDKPDKPPKPPPGGDNDEPGTEYQITSSNAWEIGPTIHGNRMVWATAYASVGPDYEIFVYDLGDDGIPFTADDGGQTQLTDNSVDDDSPRIYGNKIAFRRDDGTSAGRDLWLYDLDTQTEYQLTTGLTHITHDIYENLIVRRIEGNELWIYDLGADGVPSEDDLDYKISDCGGSNWPVIYGNKVIFRWHADLNIYYLSGNLAGQIVEMEWEHRPGDWYDLHENRIVWYDERNGNQDIFTYDLGPDGEYGTSDDEAEQQISSSPYDDTRPVVYGNRIVWWNLVYRGRGYKENVYLHDLTTQKTYAITNSGDARNPWIYDDHIVYNDERDGDWNIYLYILD
jgi:beta propeller repeat protein